MPQDDPNIFGTRHSSPGERLAISVLNRAVQDLFLRSPRTAEGSFLPTFHDKREALRFLTATSGTFAAAREFWCTMAGVNSGVLRRRVLAFLDGDDALLGAMKGSLDGRTSEAVTLQATQTRAIWAEMRTALQKKPTPKPAPKPLPRSRPKSIDHADVTARVLTALEDGPKSIRQLVFALNGDVGNDPIREALTSLIEIGRVRRDPPEYCLVETSGPQLLVAASR